MLGRKFSVSTFWRDCRVGGVTIVFYVGEMCRYLVSAPEVANEKNHSLRLMVGNGMRDFFTIILYKVASLCISRSIRMEITKTTVHECFVRFVCIIH